MNPHQLFAVSQRREFLRRSAFGLGTIALSELLANEGRSAGASAWSPKTAD